MDHNQDLNYYQLEIKNLRNQNQKLLRIVEIFQQMLRGDELALKSTKNLFMEARELLKKLELNNVV